MDTQICKVCGVDKTLKDFKKGKNKRNGIEKIYYHKTCRLCSREYDLQKSYDYKRRNRKLIADKQREYHLTHKENDSLSKKLWYQENKESVKARVKDNIYNRRKNDPIFRLKESISSKVRICLLKNRQSIKKYLPYTLTELKNHLEKQFEPWMNWNNYGVYRLDLWKDDDQNTWTWQVDHIIPHSTFRYTSMDDVEFKKCWALENLRPYSAKQNIVDGNRK